MRALHRWAWRYVLLGAVAVLGCLLQAQHGGAQADVPDAYRALYDYHAGVLDTVKQYVDAHQPSSPAPLTFGAELLTANGNRGPALLAPETMPAVRLNLDRLQGLGVQGVTIAVKYPLYTAGDPNFQGYRDFFKQVAGEVRQRGMKLDVEAGVLFANTPFSPVRVDFSTLTLPKLTDGMAQMVQDIITDLAPDYLTVISEPSTDAALTGLKELDDPAATRDLVAGVLNGLNRGSTLVGAGAGTWESPEFARELAANTSVDYIDLHIYPLAGDASRNAFAMAAYAQQYGKRLVMDEAWLYKAAASELQQGGIAATAGIFRRDAYGFFAPLDQEFLYDVTGLARILGVEYLSPFWSDYFFAYTDYYEGSEAQPYVVFMARVNYQQYQAMLSGSVSPTGRSYANLICTTNGGCGGGGP